MILVNRRLTGPLAPIGRAQTALTLRDEAARDEAARDEAARDEAARHEVAPSAGQSDQSSVRRWLIVILFSSTFLQRFGVTFGDSGVPFDFFISPMAVGVLALHGSLRVDPIRAALVLMFSSYVIISLLLHAPTATTGSAALAIFTYLPFAFMLRQRDSLFMDCVRAFRLMVLICAICGIAQFFLQAVITSPFLYTFEGYLPDSIVMPGFATYQPIAYGSPLSRSNGFFMLEPSIFSQYVALGVILEILYFQTKWRLAVYTAALIFSYSGSGLIALVVVPGILFSRRSYGILAAIAVIGCLALASSEFLHLDIVLQRSTELAGNNTNTSGYARYQAPVQVIGRYLLPYPRDLLFGFGPGSWHGYQIRMPFETHDPAWAKVLLEYGLVGSLLFGSLLFLALFKNSRSKWLATALAIGFFTFGGEFLDARLQALILVFCALPKQTFLRPAFSYRAWRQGRTGHTAAMSPRSLGIQHGRKTQNVLLT